MLRTMLTLGLVSAVSLGLGIASAQAAGRKAPAAAHVQHNHAGVPSHSNVRILPSNLPTWGWNHHRHHHHHRLHRWW